MKQYKKIIGITIIIVNLMLISACSSGTTKDTDNLTTDSESTAATDVLDNQENITSTETNDIIATTGSNISLDDFDTTSEWSNDTATIVALNENEIEIEGDGITLEDTTMTITAAGTYVFNGTLDDGQIIVDASSTDLVQIVLNGVNITSAESAPIYIKNADKTVLTLSEGTENTLSDGITYTYNNTETSEPNACIFSKDDLTINGVGTLTVNGNYNNGIDTSNDLIIVSGNINVNAVNNGIKGNDSANIVSGEINVNSKDDGIKTDNETEADQGNFYMDGGNLIITSTDDGIKAITSVIVTGGTITITSGDKDINCDGITNIAEGVLTSK